MTRGVLLLTQIDVDKAELRTLPIELPRVIGCQSFSGTSEILNALAIVASSRTQPYELTRVLPSRSTAPGQP